MAEGENPFLDEADLLVVSHRLQLYDGVRCNPKLDFVSWH